jgi:hypothetical protein
MLGSKVLRALMYPFSKGRALVTAFVVTVPYLVISIFIGGTSVNGKAVNGQYFLGDSGQFQQVSESVYRYSQIHGYISLGMLIVAAVLAYADHVREKIR